MVGPAGNIARSRFEAANVLPIDVVQVAPKDFKFRSQDCGTRCNTADDPNAIESADLIITDCWPPRPSDDEKAALRAFSIDADMLDRCKPDVFFLPCPPVTHGEEVSSDAMSHPSCVVTAAKAFLMHVQNAFVEGAFSVRP